MKRQIANGLPSSKTFVCACVCLPAGSQAAGGEQRQSIELRNPVCCSKVAATFPLTLLRTTNKYQTSTRNACERETGRKRMKTHKLLTLGAKRPPPPPSPPLTPLPSWGVRGCGSLQASLTAGQSWQRHFDVFVERLRASCPRSLTLSMTDQCEPAERLRCLKMTAYLPFWVRVWTGLVILLNKQYNQRRRDCLPMIAPI